MVSICPRWRLSIIPKRRRMSRMLPPCDVKMEVVCVTSPSFMFMSGVLPV